MKRLLSNLLITLLWSTTSSAGIQNGIDRLINQVDPSINIGVEVIDLTSGEALYSRNPDKAFIPASNMKIFSDAAALMILGPDYHFTNQLSTDASTLSKGELKGNIYLHLSGDPSFNQNNLYALLSQLNQWNINKIQGDIIIDSTHNGIKPYAPGWMLEDLSYSYGAPVAPVIIDTNRITVTVNPAGKAGSKAIIELDDPSHSININNQVLTQKKSKGCGVSFSMTNNNSLSVRGCVAQGQWAIQQRMAIRNPLAYTQGLIQEQLRQLHIKQEGQIRTGRAPQGTLLIASSQSKPIAQLMADTLKPSDNLYAESLFLHAAAKLKGQPVDWNEAPLLIKNFLQKQTGINLKNAVLSDGSGLSRHDLLTPRQTAGLLRFLHDRFHFSYEFISALPVSGRDGTLQRRFKKPSQQDFVRAKTGTMQGIVSLSGYLYTTNGHTLAFAIYINNLPGTRLSVSGRYRYLVDALCTYLLQQNPVPTHWAKIFSPHGRIPFQQNFTQAELQRKKIMKWRHLEKLIKEELKGQAVTVLYRGKELVLNDHQNNPQQVWAALEKIRKKYAYTTTLRSSTFPAFLMGQPMLLWINAEKEEQGPERTWTIKDTVG